MYGLRKVNNMYTPNGTGRDSLVYFDQGFRGGKTGYVGVQAHPGAKEDAGRRSVSLPKYAWQSFPRPTTTTPMTQILSRTHSSLSIQTPIEARKRDLASTTMGVASEHFTARSRSLSARNSDFRRELGTSHPLLPPRTFAPREVRKEKPLVMGLKPVPGDAKKSQYAGYSRAEYGGFWKA